MNVARIHYPTSALCPFVRSLLNITAALQQWKYIIFSYGLCPSARFPTMHRKRLFMRKGMSGSFFLAKKDLSIDKEPLEQFLLQRESFSTKRELLKQLAFQHKRWSIGSKHSSQSLITLNNTPCSLWIGKYLGVYTVCSTADRHF